MRIFVPNDTAACSVGADAVARAVALEAARRGIAITLVRNGSRGAAWLEPLLEVETDAGRRGFGPVAVEDVPGLFEAGFPAAGGHPLALGDPAALPWFAAQQRLSFARVGLIDPLSLADYRAHGGLQARDAALAMEPAAIIAAVERAGLRGRGGAAFPAAIKWRTVAGAPGDRKYIVCNAEEGDSGTFADRLLMEADPFQLIEGMLIAGIATGAAHGVIGLRHEYPLAANTLRAALATARAEGILGPDARGAGRPFDIELRLGAGAYVCGEETALLESLEGKRAVVRAKPPLPALQGLFGKPTLVNNVLSLAAATSIVADAGASYGALGSNRSRGTLAVQLGGNVRRGGLVEVPFGTTLRTVIEEVGGGTASGRPLKAVQVGGPLGAYLPASRLDTPLDYEAFAAIGAMLGHGGVVVFDDTADMRAQARFALEFCALESCGKCTPCRIGSTRGVELIDGMREPARRADSELTLRDLCQTMTDASLCALGGLTPLPVLSALDHFAADFA